MRNAGWFVVVLALGAPAWGATGAAGIETRDVAGSNGNWQEGSATIAAPLAEVRGWLTDFEHWPQRFPDVTAAKVLARSGDSATLRFRSKTIGRELTIKLRWTEREINYVGAGKNVNVQGKIALTPKGDGATQVIMQSTADVHGLSGAFATQGLKRDRAFKKLRADLGALERMAGTTRM